MSFFWECDEDFNNLGSDWRVIPSAVRLAQSVEHETLNLSVVGSSPTLGVSFIVKNNWTFLSYDLDFAGKILIDLELGPQITSLRAVSYCI